MAKLDIQDGFCRLECQAGEEYNCEYVLPQKDGEPVRLVIPIVGSRLLMREGAGRFGSCTGRFAVLRWNATKVTGERR